MTGHGARQVSRRIPGSVSRADSASAEAADAAFLFLAATAVAALIAAALVAAGLRLRLIGAA